MLGILFGTANTPATRGQATPPDAQTGVSVEASQSIFSVMCALDAAGFAADESTLSEMPSRLALRGELLKLQGPATEALRQFYHDYALADPGETLSRYITFALVIGPPPSFTFLLDHDVMPPDALAIEGFQEVLANFYHEAHLDLRWAAVEPEYTRAWSVTPVLGALRRHRLRRVLARDLQAALRTFLHGLHRAVGGQSHQFPQQR